MRALITGCAGFIGSNLTDHLLDKGYEVVGIDCFNNYYSKELKENNISNALKNENFKFMEKDILEMKEYPDVDYVFHMAAQAGVRFSWGKNFQIYTKNNIEATQKLLEFYKDQNIQKFIYSSSSSVYGDCKLPMNEKSLLKPVSPYGVSKLAAEYLCHLYWENYEVPTVSLRYFTVYGPRQRPDMAINKFVKSVLNGDEIVIYGNGKQTRDFTYIEDVIRAIVASADSNLNGEVLNIAGGSRISINTLINEIELISGHNANIRYSPNQKGDAKDTWADLNRTKKLLGWEPTINIHEGLRNYIKWYQQE
ncbi:GDP-mannose 4,6-dehydratase [Methanobacterium sp.]|uniref:GDP-mannose 4,6-dehydratase n=1 Tax=Methanobacterium sp. TaxID=2164 RepID=UPI003C7727FE